MGVYDDQWVLSDSEQPSALVVGTAISADVHDLQLSTVNKGIYPFGACPPRYIHAYVTTAPTSGGSATINLQFVSASDAALTTAVTVHYESGVLAFDNAFFALNSFHQFALHPNDSYEEFLGFRFVIGTANLTDGAFFLALTDTASVRREFEDARNFGL